MKLFPIMVEYRNVKTTEYIPHDVIGCHEKQAMINHGQTLQRLAERGGLSYCEALAVIEDRKWTRIEQDEAKPKVLKIIMDFELSSPSETNKTEEQQEFELRILKNYEKTLSKAYRKRTDNATLIHNILLSGTSTSGRTSCCDKCRELGVDPYSHSVN